MKTFDSSVAGKDDRDAPSPDESVDEYLVSLRRIAVTCNFGAYLDSAAEPVGFRNQT